MPRVVLSRIPRYTLEFAILLLLSSIVFYFFQFPFSLFCFLVALGVSLTWVLLMNEKRLERRIEVRLALTPYLLPPAAVLLLAFAASVGAGYWVTVPIGVFVTYFIPGLAVLSLLGARKGGGGFSSVGMACALSVAVNGLVYSILAIVSVSSGYYPDIFLGIYLALSLVPIARRATTSKTMGGSALSFTLTELVSISGCAAVVAAALLILYPTEAFVKSYDVTVHFTVSRVASLFPTYLKGPYPFFPFNEAITMILSRPQAGSSLLLAFNPVLQATLALMGGLVLMLTFYSLAKSYLKGLDSRMPMVATGIFMLFGGLAWTQVQNLAFGQPFSLVALNKLYLASYWDVQAGPAQFFWFWFRPITVGTLCLMLLLSLLADRHEDPRRRTALIALLVMGLFFVHVPELILFTALLLVLALLKPASLPGLGQVAAGLALSCPFVALLALEQIRLGILQLGLETLGLFLLGSLLTYVFSKFVPRPDLRVSPRIVRILGLLSLVAYLTFMVIWLRSPLSFTSSSVTGASLQIVPIGIYPVLLGIGGMLALSAFVFYDDLKSRPLAASIYVLVILFIIGRALSLLNFYAFDTGYWEKRVVLTLAVPTCILASYSLVRICSVVRGRMSSFAMVATLGLVVVLGTSSLFAGVSYGTTAVLPDSLGPSELPMATYLASNVTAFHPIFPSAREIGLANYARYTAVNPRVGNASQLNYDEEYPEVPLISMIDTGFGSPYVLASTSEIDNPGTSIRSDYMLTHLLGVLPVQYASDTSVLYSLGNISAPSQTSRTCIGVAASPTAEELYAYDMLSVLKANYTTVLDTDASLISCSSIFLGASISQPALEQLLSGAGNAPITVLGGVSNEYLSSLFLQTAGPQPTNVDEVSGPSGTLPLPSPLPIISAQPAPGVDVTSEYMGPPNVSVPLSLRTLIGTHEVTYVNIEPFIETPRAAYPCFPVIAEAAGIHINQVQSNPNLHGSLEAAFTTASLVGATTFKTTSVVINSANPTIQVGLLRAQGPTEVETTFVAASLSIFSDMGIVTVHTSSSNIAGGAGFYAYASVNGTFTGEGSNLEARLTFPNDTSTVLGSVKIFIISEPASEPQDFELSVRAPAVSVSGSVVLTDLVALNTPSFSNIRGSAAATFSGDVSFKLALGDYYSILSALRYSAGVSYSGTSIVWNDVASLESISPELVVAGLFLVWWHYFRRPSRGEAAAQARQSPMPS